MDQNKPLLRDKVAWDGNRLVVIEDGLVDGSLRRQALSASTSKSMQSCAARWVGERLLRSDDEDPFAPAPLGTSAHSVLEDMYDERVYAPEQRSMRLAEKILLRDADEKWPDVPEESDSIRAAVKILRRKWIADVKEAYEGIFVIEDPKTIRVYDREMQIDGLTINGVPTNGFIDRIRYGTGKRGKEGLVVEDYKTGKMPSPYHLRYGDDHGDQIRIYAAALKEKTGELPVGGTVLYTKFGKDRPIDLSPAAMGKTLKTFELSWKRHNRYMKSGEFPTKVSALCGWCPLVNSCPVAKAEGKTVSEKVADQMHSATELGIGDLHPKSPVPHQPEAEDVMVAKHGQEVSFFMPDPFAFGIPDELSDEVESAADLAAHMYDSGAYPADRLQKDPNMKITEGKPWDLYTIEGEMNPVSYAAPGVFGLAELAVETLHRAGREVKGGHVKALAFTFLHITAEAQESWTGSRGVGDAAATRMRGALRTVLATMPIPFGEDAAAWEAWVAAAIRRCRSITAIALSLFGDECPESPWEALAGGAPAPAEKATAAEEQEPAQAHEQAEADTAEEASGDADEEEAPAPKAPARRVVKRAAKKADPAEDFDFVPDDLAGLDEPAFA